MVSTDDLMSLPREILALADARGVPLRVLGGVAIEQPPPTALTQGALINRVRPDRLVRS